MIGESSTAMEHAALVEITPAMLAAARVRHRGLIEIVDRAAATSRSMPFFQKMATARGIADFAWTRELFHHSRTLTRFIGLALSHESDDEMMRFYAGHLIEEAPHSGWLADWMMLHGLVSAPDEPVRHPPGRATLACIEYGRRLASDYDREAWLVGINCGIEKCSHTFFSFVEPIARRLGLGHKYFSAHVEADIYHSTEALVFVPPLEPATPRAIYLRDLVLEGISLWCGMLNSWVGSDEVPRFGPDGHPR